MVTYDGHLFELCNNIIVSDAATISKDKQLSLLTIKVCAARAALLGPRAVPRAAHPLHHLADMWACVRTRRFAYGPRTMSASSCCR